jgi:hypothetical protein
LTNLKQIRDYIITPSLKAVDLYSPEATDLLLYTGLQESRYEYVAQLGNGPARSFWQVEPNTARDHFENYLKYREDLLFKVNEMTPIGRGFKAELTLNLGFAVVMARLVYRRSPDPLPELGDGVGMAKIYKKVYNTPLGRNWERHKGEL